jgi:phosphonate transport system substrate-binding protein
MTIRCASFLGDNGRDFYRQVVAYLGTASKLETEFVVESTSGFAALIAARQIDAAFVCGLAFVREAAAGTVVPLAAPVMTAERYNDRPVYFSDVVVRCDSRLRTWADLHGARFVYNDPASYSGYVAVLHSLYLQGESLGFFGSAEATGSHAASLDWIECGRADAAAIDSVVLEMELAQHPERAHIFRCVASLGPAPMPPVVMASWVAPAERERLAQGLTAMHATPSGQAILRQAGVRRYERVTDRDYDPMRAVLQALPAAPAA